MPARVYGTRDVAVRLGFIKPGHVVVPEASREEPVAVFNPGLFVDGDRLVLYPRVVTGYYRYVSAIGRLELSLADVLEGLRPGRWSLRVDLAVVPGAWEDFWGAEDPRVTVIAGRRVMVYTGRTSSYFTQGGVRVVPVVAVEEDGRWVRRGYIAARGADFDKDAFIVEAEGGGALLLFHRPRVDGSYLMAVTRLGSLPRGRVEAGIGDVILEPEAWEEKLGWGAPPVEADGRLVALVHAVDKDLGVYRVLGVVLRLSGRRVVVEGVTRHYVMEPRAVEERFGDRPHVVFPTGAARVDDYILVAYGAADTAVGLALIRVDELLADVAWA